MSIRRENSRKIARCFASFRISDALRTSNSLMWYGGEYAMTEEHLFDLALHAPPGERAALLDRECAGNPELRARIEALLAAAPAATGGFVPSEDDDVRPPIPQLRTTDYHPPIEPG